MSYDINLHPYNTVCVSWPKTGQHIIGTYNDDAIVVYQAYNDQIADYVLGHQKFEGCPGYNHTRMTWVKTNFLWMMYRSKYASKRNQNRILGLWMKRDAFEDILSSAKFKGGKVRIQWDPDYMPNLQRFPHPRKDIQLGIKLLKRPSFLNGDDFIRIVDYTQLAKESKNNASIPFEKVYVPRNLDFDTKKRIGLSNVEKS